MVTPFFTYTIDSLIGAQCPMVQPYTRGIEVSGFDHVRLQEILQYPQDLILQFHHAEMCKCRSSIRHEINDGGEICKIIRAVSQYLCVYIRQLTHSFAHLKKFLGNLQTQDVYVYSLSSLKHRGYSTAFST